MPKKERKDLNMHIPADRAIFISDHMSSPAMQYEVIGQFEDMAAGGDGGYCDSFETATYREKYYKHFSDKWFSDVLYEYGKLQHYKRMQMASG